MIWLLFIVLSAILLAAFILMLRRDIMHEPNTQVFSLSYIMFIILIPIISLLSGIPLEHEAFIENWLFFVLIATAFSVSLFATTLALKSLPLTIVGPLRNLSPLFVAILGFFLLGEQLSTINIIGLGVVVLGVIFLDIDIRHPSNITAFLKHMKNPAVFLLVIAAVAISFTPILAKVLLKATNSLTMMFYIAILLTIIFWTVHCIATRSPPWRGLSIHEFLWILLTGVTILLADIFYYLALAVPGVLAAVVFGVRRLSNLFVTIFGGAILHEDNAFYKAVMCLVMVAGTVLLVL